MDVHRETIVHSLLDFVHNDIIIFDVWRHLTTCAVMFHSWLLKQVQLGVVPTAEPLFHV